MSMTTGIFKSRASIKHSGKYDYSKSAYYKYHEKVIIICESHGEFLQSPAKHLAGQGCPKCAIICVHDQLKRPWTEEEIQIVKDNYLKIGMTLTAELLNMWPNTVYEKAKTLGLTKTIKKKTYHENVSKVIWNSVVGGAERRRLPIEITKDDIWEKFLEQNERCLLTGQKLFFGKTDQEITGSVDRIDSSKGYTKDNIQIVHKLVNRSKQDMSDEDFYILCKNVYLNLSTKDKYKDL